MRTFSIFCHDFHIWSRLRWKTDNYYDHLIGHNILIFALCAQVIRNACVCRTSPLKPKLLSVEATAAAKSGDWLLCYFSELSIPKQDRKAQPVNRNGFRSDNSRADLLAIRNTSDVSLHYTIPRKNIVGRHVLLDMWAVILTQVTNKMASSIANG